MITPDQGSIALDGQPVRFANPREAHAAGIVIIPQELDLVPGLDIAANLFLGNERLTAYRTLDRERMPTGVRRPGACRCLSRSGAAGILPPYG